jgi:hypothetical protein
MTVVAGWSIVADMDEMCRQCNGGPSQQALHACITRDTLQSMGWRSSPCQRQRSAEFNNLAEKLVVPLAASGNVRRRILTPRDARPRSR